MKKNKIYYLITALMLTAVFVFSQSTTGSFTSTLRFLNSDNLQIYQGARLAAPSMTLPNSATTYTSTLKFGNSDNLQIYQAVRGLGDAITSGTATVLNNAWKITGNAPTTNTNFIGTTNKRSLLFKTNNLQRFKIDSLGGVTITPSLSDFAIPLTIKTNTAGNSYVISEGPNNSAYLLGNTTTGNYWYLSNSTTGLVDIFSIGKTGNPTAAPFQINQSNRVLIGNTAGTGASTATLGVLGTMSVSSTATIGGSSILGSVNGGNTLTINTGTSGYLNGTKIMELPATPGIAAIYFNQSSPSISNYALAGQTSGTNLNSTTKVILAINNNGIMSVTSGGARMSTNNGANDPVASALLDLNSTSKGFLPPRMTAAQGSAISSPAEGLLIYVTDTNGTFTAKGWWGYNGASWEKLNN